MLDLLVRKSKAYAAVEHVLDKYPDLVSGTPVLKTATDDFKLRKKAIESFKVPSRSATLTITNDKDNLMEAVFVNAETERNAVILYAQDNNLPELEGKMPRIVTQMQEGSGEERLRIYQNVHDEAKALGDKLVPFGCEASIISELDEQLPLLRKKLSASQNAIDDRTAKQQSFEQLFVDMDDFIKARLDRAVRTRLKASPAFVAEYLEAKVMPASSSRSPKDASATPKKKTAKAGKAVKSDKLPTPPPVNEEPISFRDLPEPEATTTPTELPATEPQASENGTAV